MGDRLRAAATLTLLPMLALTLCVCRATPATAAGIPHINHLFIIVLENEDADESFGANPPAPYLGKTLKEAGAFMPNYFGIGHNSLDNYIAQISGQSPNSKTQGDCDPYVNFVSTGTGAYGQALGSGCVYPASVPTIASQLTAAGRTWKAYQEDMANSATEPKSCRHPVIGSHDATETARLGDEYSNKHDPFVYFHSIIDLPICTTNVVDLTQLNTDLTTEATTPNLSYITPNLCDDGHDAPCIDGRPGGLVSADAWLTTWVPKIMASPAYADDGLIVITFDEAEPTGSGTDATACCNTPPAPNTSTPGVVGPGGGRVGALLLSPHVAPNSTDETPYNHYSLLCSMEDAFGLPRLGFAGAPGLTCFGSDVYDR
jgi:phospholipase C